jgi:hypothetical protein
MHTKPTFRHNRVFCKVRKTGHQCPEFGPEFGPKPGEIPKKNTCKEKSTLAFFEGGFQTQKCTTFLCQTEFLHPVLTPSSLFPERLQCCYIYIYFHCSYMQNYYNYLLEPCALNAEFQLFIPRLLYFVDLT